MGCVWQAFIGVLAPAERQNVAGPAGARSAKITS